ncbi:MAG: hypothetical protein ACK417_02980 [Bacteroidia bacterium]|jgi:copper chaperone NosL
MNKSLLLLCFLGVVLLWSCDPQPRPIEFGKDACNHCKMIISDPRYGAELVTKKGKIFVFDDLNCYWSFRQQQGFTEEEIAHSVVFVFNEPQTYVEAGQACFLYAEGIRSPMASGFAAFSSSEACNEHRSNWQAVRMSWSDVRQKLQR